jgi:Leucine-rich repeat (LRR) protein
MKKYLENKLTNLPEQTTPTVMSRIRLDLGQQETLEYFYYKRMILKECLVELPALRKVILISCFLTELDPTTFQNLLHLEELDLSFNLIRVLDEKTFSGNKNLTVLRLSGNEIKSLSKETFKGLSKLTQLYFYNNYLRLIPEGLFQDLSSLRFVYLDNNRINFLDGNGSQQSSDVFKGLESLTLLELGCNSISVIPKGIFKHLVSLRNLHLYGNKLNLYDLYEASKYLKGFKRKFKVIWNQSTLS